MGQTIQIAASDRGAFETYLALPKSGKGPGVAIVSTIFGIEDDVRGFADRLAADGFVAAIPNVFWRVEDSVLLQSDVPSGHPIFKRAVARAMQLDIDKSMGDLAAVFAALKRRPECNGRIAAMGFCWGGRYALRAAAECDIEVAISFHGTQVTKALDVVDKVRCPMSFHWGDKDFVVPMPEIETIKTAFDRRPDAEIRVYPGVEHSYMLKNRGSAYSESATRASWSRAMELLTPLK